jgi:hypothetical protein
MSGFYDKYQDDRPTTSAEELRGLRVMLSGDIKRLYEITESDTKLGNGVIISRDQKNREQFRFSSDIPQHNLNSSSDSTDSLFIPFWNVKGDHENAYGEKCPSAYKIISPTSDEENRSKGGHTRERESAHKNANTY